MRNQQALKLFLVLIISTTYIYSFSHFGAFAYDEMIHSDNKYAEGTMIGQLNVTDKTVQEAGQLLDEQISKWLEETQIDIKYKEVTHPLDLSLIHFDVSNTLAQLKQGQQNSVIVNLESLEDVLYNLSPSINLSNIDIDRLKEQVLLSAKMLQVGDSQFRVENYMIDQSQIETVNIAEAVLELEEVPSDLSQLANTSIEVLPQTQFSLLSYINELGLDDISTTSLGVVATGIYEVILPTNFSIIERHISNELPSYANLGYEAKVNQSKDLDLIFSNPNEFSYTINMKLEDDTFSVTLSGPELLNKYSVIEEDEESFSPKTVVQYSPLLSSTEIKVEKEGVQGLLIKLYRESYDVNGELLKKDLISEDFYPPIHRIEIHALSGNQTTNPNSSGNDGIDNEGNDDSSENENGNSNPDVGDEESDTEGEVNEDDLWGKPNEESKK
ncbi:VanW family protein [Cytobacillus sp. FJAT-54145]|uniref:VanW family protein n=1 Tax=Cytobacillus spartinae TaxID=3299023 RepID=A0ABW6KGQ6_9BACI